MKINSVGVNYLGLQNLGNIKNNRNLYSSKLNTLTCDTVSFTGQKDSTVKENLIDALSIIGFVGVPFAANLILGAELMKRVPQGDQIFLSDGTYLCDIKDLSVESDKVVADADDGILKVKDSPIDIDASRYDYADPSRGVYKNFDGSVDIDLLNEKYIDSKNGIFVDVKNNLAAFVEDGKVRDLPLINFKGSPMSGNSPSFTPPYPVPANMLEDNPFEVMADDVKRAINILFDTNIPTGYIIEKDGSKIRKSEWLKQHDVLNRDFTSESDTAEKLQDYVKDHHIPVSFNGEDDLVLDNYVFDSHSDLGYSDPVDDHDYDEHYECDDSYNDFVEDVDFDL